jgi:hypothetical protein
MEAIAVGGTLTMLTAEYHTELNICITLKILKNSV